MQIEPQTTDGGDLRDEVAVSPFNADPQRGRSRLRLPTLCHHQRPAVARPPREAVLGKVRAGSAQSGLLGLSRLHARRLVASLRRRPEPDARPGVGAGAAYVNGASADPGWRDLTNGRFRRVEPVQARVVFIGC